MSRQEGYLRHRAWKSEVTVTGRIFASDSCLICQARARLLDRCFAAICVGGSAFADTNNTTTSGNKTRKRRKNLWMRATGWFGRNKAEVMVEAASAGMLRQRLIACSKH